MIKTGVNTKKSFTLIEIITVVIILGVIAALAIAGYQKTVEIARERNSIVQLKALRAAMEMYFIRHNNYGPVDPGNGDVFPLRGATAINARYGTNIYDPYGTYKCFFGATAGDDYDCFVRNSKGWVLDMETNYAPDPTNIMGRIHCWKPNEMYGQTWPPDVTAPSAPCPSYPKIDFEDDVEDF